MKIISVIDYNTFGEDFLSVACSAAPYSEMIWFRIKEPDANRTLKLSLRLRQILPTSKLIISERADIAVAAGFNGVHLNSRSMSAEDVKRAFPNLIVGYSAHSNEECMNVTADYITLSPIFDSNKAIDQKPLGLVNSPRSNVYAMGGINSKNYSMLYGRGFAGIAGIRLAADLGSF